MTPMGPQTLDQKVEALQHLNPDAHAIDAAETRDWLESLEDVLHSRGQQRVREILSELQIHAQKRGVALPMTSQTPYVNTILARAPATVSGQPGIGAADQEHHPLERHGHGGQGQS